MSTRSEHLRQLASRCALKAAAAKDSAARASLEAERADALMAELLKMTADAMAAKEAAARLEGGQVRLCQELSDVHSDRDAWRSEVERLILIEYRRNARECLPCFNRACVHVASGYACNLQRNQSRADRRFKGWRLQRCLLACSAAPRRMPIPWWSVDCP